MDNVSLFRQAAEGTRIVLKPDWFVLSDGTAAAVPSLRDGKRLSDAARVKVFIDHETPCGSEAVAALQRRLIRFAQENRCQLFNGYGVSYQLMLDEFVAPGQLVVHCGDFGSIYGCNGALALKLTPEEMAAALESGEISVAVPNAISLKVVGQLAAPACAKDAALTALAKLGDLKGKILLVSGTGLEGLDAAERTAFYQMLSASNCVAALPCQEEAQPVELDLTAVVPTVSGPNDTGKAVPAAQLTNTAVTAVFIGGCSAGRIEDIRKAAAIAKGKKVARKVRTMIAFATTEVYVQAANEGLINILLDAGALVMNQGCSACYAHSQGLVDGKDIVLSAGSRNCPNCNGAGDATTYLCSAATAMASAIAGHICPAEA